MAVLRRVWSRISGATVYLWRWGMAVPQRVWSRITGTVAYVWRWTGAVARGRRWWVAVAAGLLLLAAGNAALSSLGAQLKLMHVPGVEGYGAQGTSTSHLRDAVAAWRDFWYGTPDAPSAMGLVASPLTIAKHWLRIDLLVFIPGYLIAGTIALRRATLRGPSRLKRLGLVGVGALFAGTLCDVFENVLSLRALGPLRDGVSAGASRVVAWFTIAKTILLIVAGAILLVYVLRAWATRTKKARAAATLLRGHIGIAVAAAALFSVPIQLPDIFMKLDPTQRWSLIGTVLLLAIATWASGRWLVARREERGQAASTSQSVPSPLLVVPLLVALALTIVNGITDGDVLAPAIPVVIAAAVFVLGWFVEPRPTLPTVVHDLGTPGVVLPYVLVVVVLTSAGMAAIKALATLAVTADDVPGVWLDIAIVVAGVAVVARLLYWLEHVIAGTGPVWGQEKPAASLAGSALGAQGRSTRSRRLGVVVAVTATITIVVSWALLAFRVPAARGAGTAAVAFLFFSAATLLVAMAVLAADAWTGRFGLPRLFVALRLRTIPVFSLLLVWGIAAALIDDGRHWDVRKLSGTATIPVTLDAAFKGWMVTALEGTTPGNGRSAVPVVFVAASGGGIRAAYWTALTLDCVFSGRATRDWEGDDPCEPAGPGPEDVFLASGISGGSLGLIEWDASRLAKLGDTWVEERLGEDFVAPTVAWGLMVEVPRSFLHFAADDRAEVLEESWEREWEADDPNLMERGFLAGQAARVGTGPLLMLNGSSVLDGCVMNVSILDEGRRGAVDLPLTDCTAGNETTLDDEPEGELPMTADLVDYLDCGTGDDVRRSTAALLSARFPYVSSAGRLLACPGESTKYVVDGGYLDSSGADPPIAAYLAIEHLIQEHNALSEDSCIVPYFLQIDNGYLDPVSPPRSASPPNQLLAPLQTLFASTGLQSRAERARTLAAEIFTRPFPTVPGHPTSVVPGSRYALIVPHRHPGVEAPLGWMLSDASQRDLEDQLYTGNEDAIGAVKDWVSNPPACERLHGTRAE